MYDKKFGNTFELGVAVLYTQNNPSIVGDRFARMSFLLKKTTRICWAKRKKNHYIEKIHYINGKVH